MLRDAAGGEASGEYSAGRFDPATAAFSYVSLGRPAGDCGLSARWAFDGKDFHLSELTYQDRCGGIPQDWLPLFKSRILELD